MRILFYTKDNCSLCEEAYALLKLFETDYEFEIEERDIYTNEEWLEEYQLLIPALQIGDTFLTCEKSLLYDEVEHALATNCIRK